VNGSDYLKDLQNFEQQQGAARLRTVAAEFFSTLDRLPKLKQEVDAMQQMQGVNFDDLAASLEQRLDRAADLLARFDLLPSEIRNASELEGFEHGLQNAMTLRTIGTWAAEFDNRCSESQKRIAQQKEAEERARQEELRLSAVGKRQKQRPKRKKNAKSS